MGCFLHELFAAGIIWTEEEGPRLPMVTEALTTVITLGLLFSLCGWGLYLPEAARSFPPVVGHPFRVLGILLSLKQRYVTTRGISPRASGITTVL